MTVQSTPEHPVPGYYPDPSIPGFVRYWDGDGWTPGSARRAPAEGEVLSPPKNARPPRVRPQTEPVWEVPRSEETGPVFLDETGASALWTAREHVPATPITWGVPPRSEPPAAVAGLPAREAGAPVERPRPAWLEEQTGDWPDAALFAREAAPRPAAGDPTDDGGPETRTWGGAAESRPETVAAPGGSGSGAAMEELPSSDGRFTHAGADPSSGPGNDYPRIPGGLLARNLAPSYDHPAVSGREGPGPSERADESPDAPWHDVPDRADSRRSGPGPARGLSTPGPGVPGRAPDGSWSEASDGGGSGGHVTGGSGPSGPGRAGELSGPGCAVPGQAPDGSWSEASDGGGSRGLVTGGSGPGGPRPAGELSGSGCAVPGHAPDGSWSEASDGGASGGHVTGGSGPGGPGRARELSGSGCAVPGRAPESPRRGASGGRAGDLVAQGLSGPAHGAVGVSDPRRDAPGGIGRDARGLAGPGRAGAFPTEVAAPAASQAQPGRGTVGAGIARNGRTSGAADRGAQERQVSPAGKRLAAPAASSAAPQGPGSAALDAATAAVGAARPARAPRAGVPALTPAPGWRRAGARAVDLALTLGTTALLAGVPLVQRTVTHLQDKVDAARLSGLPQRVWFVDPTVLGCAGALLAVVLGLGLVYEAVPTALRGRTLGKALFGLRVVDVRTRRRPGLGRAVARLFSTTLLLGIGRDRLGRTRVVCPAAGPRNAGRQPVR